MAESKLPIIHFGFDGTIVETAPKWSRRNFRKYPLSAMPGFVEFYDGLHLEDTDETPLLEIGNIISRRPDISWRRTNTERSLADIGLIDEFPANYVRLEGKVLPWWDSEKRIAIAVLESATGRVTGMIEDKPHNLGLEMVRYMVGGGVVYEPIVLGVVNHPEADTRIERLEQAVVAEFGGRIAVDHENDGVQISSFEQGSFTLDVVRIGAYSQQAGVNFAQRLLDYSS